MTDRKPRPRLRLVRTGETGGETGETGGTRVRETPASATDIGFVCAECDGRALAEIRFGARVVDGELTDGELWWACARCLMPHFRSEGD